MQNGELGHIPLPPVGRLEAVPGTSDTVFNWDYEILRPGLASLYEKGKRLQCNASTDIDWSVDVDPERFPDFMPPEAFNTLLSPPRTLAVQEIVQLRVQQLGWMPSQFLHGEQGALLATAQIVGAAGAADDVWPPRIAARLRERSRMTTPWTEHLGSRAGAGIVLLTVALGLAACSITTRVEPLQDPRIAAVCIKENPQVWSKQFLPELRKQFERYGIHATVYTQDPPADCQHRVEYTANWKWDVAVYLKYADIRVYDGDRLVGSATYDARHGGGRPDKFGSTSAKLQRLMDQLLRTHGRVEPGGA